MKKTRNKIGHGSESLPTKYNIRQCNYAAGQTGYIEVLSIRNPPKGCGRFIIHSYHRQSDSSTFSEWSKLKFARAAFKRTSGPTIHFARKEYVILAGYVQITDCPSGKEPWFYKM